ISEFLNSGEGTRCRVTQYFPDYALANEIWWGFLKQPKETEGLWFNIEAASGLRSPNLIVPRRAIYPGCQATFGGLINPDTGLPYFDTQAKISPPANDCPYNLHIGGSVGLVNPGTGAPFTSCPRRVPSDCTARLGGPTATGGGVLNYMAFDVVLEGVVVGAGNQHQYLASSRANESVLRKPLRVVYGYRWIRDLIFLAYVSESYGDHPEAVLLRTLWAVCEGPIIGSAEFSDSWAPIPSGITDAYLPKPTAVPMSDNWSGFVVNGQQVTNQHTHYGGIWGTPHQSTTAFSPSVLNYP